VAVAALRLPLEAVKNRSHQMPPESLQLVRSMIATLEFRVAPPNVFEIHTPTVPITRFIESYVSFLSKPLRPGMAERTPAGIRGLLFFPRPRLLAFFCERGIVDGMSESDRNALASKLAEIDQLIAENEEVLFSLNDDAWALAEKLLEKLLELRQGLEWELMAQ
jgi:hypothetical protein